MDKILRLIFNKTFFSKKINVVIEFLGKFRKLNSIFIYYYIV